jgi:hypothetical protein
MFHAAVENIGNVPRAGKFYASTASTRRFYGMLSDVINDTNDACYDYI